MFSFFLNMVFNKTKEVRAVFSLRAAEEGPEKGEYSMIGRKKLVIEPAWCKGCGICAAFCPKQVLEIQKEKVTVKDPEACILCGMCELRCPDYAIYLVNLEE